MENPNKKMTSLQKLLFALFLFYISSVITIGLILLSYYFPWLDHPLF